MTHGLKSGDLDGLSQPALALTARAVANIGDRETRQRTAQLNRSGLQGSAASWGYPRERPMSSPRKAGTWSNSASRRQSPRRLGASGAKSGRKDRQRLQGIRLTGSTNCSRGICDLPAPPPAGQPDHGCKPGRGPSPGYRYWRGSTSRLHRIRNRMPQVDQSLKSARSSRANSARGGSTCGAHRRAGARTGERFDFCELDLILELPAP